MIAPYGVFTAVGAVLCQECAGYTFDGSKYSDTRYVECTCQNCDKTIRILEEVGCLRLVQYAIEGDPSPLWAAMWQTGGMCSALCIGNHGGEDDGIFIVTALDGPMVGCKYTNEEAFYEGEWDEEDYIEFGDSRTVDDVVKHAKKVLL